jgi:hypothetical protein
MSTLRWFILLRGNDLEKGKSCALRGSEFWKRGCRQRIMDGTEETRIEQRPGDWRLLAERASVEMDPEKLMNLVLELNSVLEERQRNH